MRAEDRPGCRPIPIGATARQDPQDVDYTRLCIALKAYPPVADPQAPFIGVGQLHDIAGWRVSRKSIEGTDDAATIGGSRRLKSRPARAEKIQLPLGLKRPDA
jgi:hypothetical protein